LYFDNSVLDTYSDNCKTVAFSAMSQYTEELLRFLAY